MEENKKIETEESVNEEVLKIETETIETLKDALEGKKKELSELQDKYLRLYAEFENFKKVVAKEQTELLRYGHERLITEILPVIDNLERAIAHSKALVQRFDSEGVKALQGLLSGVEMTLKLMLDAVGRFGVKEIKALGEAFDPSRHHAVSQIESNEHEPNTVVEVLSKGYSLNDRVIRPSMVVVSKKVLKETETQDDKGTIIDIASPKD